MGSRQSHSPEAVVRDIRRKTRRKFSTEEKIRIVLEGLKGETSIAELCRREVIFPRKSGRVKKPWLPFSRNSVGFGRRGSSDGVDGCRRFR